MRRLLNLSAVALILSSCAFHSGMMNDSASLHGQDFELIGMSVGQSNTTHVLGIGGLDPTGLVLEAKRNMYKLFPLKKGQAYANLSLDFKRSYFFIVNTTKATVSADIVQFGEAKTDSLQKLFQNGFSLAYLSNMTDNMEVGIMLNGELIRVNILKKSNSGMYTLIDYNGRIYENMSQFLLYNMSQGYTSDQINFKVGDQVDFKNDANYLLTGIVIGIAGQTVAIRTEEKTHQVFDTAIIEVIE